LACQGKPPAPKQQSTQAAEPDTQRCGCPSSFADLAARVDPGVVFIETVQPATSDEGGHGLGSGFVIDPAGLVLTNHHVVRGATKVYVQLQERQLEASVVGEDPLTDVAVVKIDAEGLPALPLGDSAKARVGDWVVAIGNPFGLSHTVSAGIISARGRTRHDVDLDPAGYYSFLQTDASINPGNSGGPLLDTDGKVVGMNTAIRAGANSIGFAIPIDMIKSLLPSLLREGRLRRSHLGIVAETFDAEEARNLDLGTTPALVKVVAPGSPGDQAGLRAGDLILEFDGQVVTGKEKLRWLASIAGVGQKVRLKIRRGPRVMELSVVLGAMPEQ
jgi:serine protease Do